ncbi:hypothetical protein HPB50_002129 [Hyalomma asiaticum]|uniref:Uncharacterized protein n=1 Tax=Hyalomma asiaticum TaxID=266040 RepID=A0ACB7SUF7_HYAAI|nr:hypothetical protein HPB50_002129 [Hyalomma asiaticum]
MLVKSMKTKKKNSGIALSPRFRRAVTSITRKKKLKKSRNPRTLRPMSKKRKQKEVSSTASLRERETTAPTPPAEPTASAGTRTRKERKFNRRAASHKKARHNKDVTGETSTPAERAPDSTAAEHGIHQEPRSDEAAGRLIATRGTAQARTIDANDSALPVPMADPVRVASRDPAGVGLQNEPNDAPAGVADSGASEPTVSRRSDTSTQIFVVGIALLVLIVVLSRSFLPVADNAYRGEKLVSSNHRVCRTSACVEYSRHLQRSLSTKANPCYNFYRYVCDTWTSTSGSVLTEASERLKMQALRAWIDDGHEITSRRRVSERTLLAASLFRSCVSGDGLGSGSSSNGLAELRTLMNQRGLTWPNASAPAPRAQDLLEVLVDWTLNWNVDVWFSLQVIFADASRHGFTFHARHSKTLQRWSKERAILKAQEQYVAFVSVYAREFGANDSEELDRALQDVVETESEIEKFLIDYASEHDLTTGGFQQHKTETDTERWRSAIRRCLEASVDNVNAGGIAFISSQGLIAAVAILLSRDDKKEKYYSYVGWAVARELGRLVSNSLRALHGMTSPELLLWCSDRMDKLTSTALVEPFYRSALLNGAATLSQKMFNAFRNAIPLALAENSWMDNRTKKIASSRIATLSLAFGFVKGTVRHVPHAHQPRESVGNGTPFGLWQRAAAAYQSLSLEVKAGLHSYDLLTSNAFFHGDTSTVQLQPTLLQMPLFADSLPVSLRYAGLGYVIVHQMMHALGDIFPLLEEDLRDTNLQSHPSIQERNRRVQCLRSFHREASASLGKAFSRHNYSDWFCDFATAPYLYEAVFGPPWESAGRPSRAQQEERLVGIEELSAEQLFFVGLCSTLCAKSNADGAPSLAEARCNVPLMHMPQFESAFQCAPGLPMTPTARCSFW